MIGNRGQLLEILVHIDRSEAPADYVFARAQIVESDIISVGDLPGDWLDAYAGSRREEAATRIRGFAQTLLSR